MRAIRNTPSILPSWIALAPFLLVSTSFGQSKPTPHTSCIARHNPTIVYEKDRKTWHEEDRWKVDCHITIGDREVYAANIPLPEPADYRTAMDGIEDFRLHKAPQIIKDAAK